MANYRENPEQAVKEFNDFRDKIANCVSVDDIERECSILKQTQEWVKYNNSLLLNAINITTDNLLKDMNLEEKLQNLDKLDKENQGTAWRPESGHPDIVQIEGNHLRKMKENLEKKIKKITTKSLVLKSEISDSRKNLLEKQKKMQNFFEETTQDSE